VYNFLYLFVAQKDKTHDFSCPRKKLVQSADEKATATQKRACAQKIEKLLQNGWKMHGIVHDEDEKAGDLMESKKLDLQIQSDPVFQTYVLHGEKREECASWAWVIRGFISGDLFDFEGIWIPSRVWVFQVMQTVIIVLYFFAVKILIKTAMKNADEASAELPDGLPEWIYGKWMFYKFEMVT
jgi:hypothetical protein